MKARIISGLVLAALLGMMFPCLAITYAGSDVVVIANKDVPISAISEGELKKIFLAKKTEWGDGQNIDFVILKNGGTHDGFLQAYISKTSSQFERYFRTLIFTGKGKAPRSFSSEDEVINYVSSTRGAIGYVSAGKHTGSVKVLTVN